MAPFTTARSASRTRQTLTRLGALTLVAMLATAFTAAPTFAAKPSADPEYSTIELGGVQAIRSGEEPKFSKGSTVDFKTKVVGLKGTEYPMVSVTCFLGDGSVAWGSLTHPDESVTLGSGANVWSSMSPTPDTTCEAHLFAFGGKYKGMEVIRELTDPQAGVLSFATEG